MDGLLAQNLEDALVGFVHDIREEPPADGNSEPKIWLLVRRDLDMTVQKFGAQAGHAFGTCMVRATRANSDVIDRYMATGQAKIVVRVKHEAELHDMVRLCREEMLNTVIVEDAGRTEFGRKTYTVAAVGPCLRDELPKKVKGLQLFKGYDA